MKQKSQTIALKNTINPTKIFYLASLLALSFVVFFYSASVSAQTPPPPQIGENTKGRPAIAEPQPTNVEQIEEQTSQTSNETASPFGTSTVTEHKRESGQVYLIELEHSLGGKQYLYENDSDGKIGSSVESDESQSDLPKWKLGSW